jgi:hypothetical protein
MFSNHKLKLVYACVSYSLTVQCYLEIIMRNSLGSVNCIQLYNRSLITFPSVNQQGKVFDADKLVNVLMSSRISSLYLRSSPATAHS